MRKSVLHQIVALPLFCGILSGVLHGQQPAGQGWQQPYESKILESFKLTQLTPDGLSVASPGTVAVLQKDNLALYAQTRKRFYTPEDGYVDGAIDPEMTPGFLERAQNSGEVHILNAGERLWLTSISFEKKGNGASLHFFTDPINGVHYVAVLKFKFPKNTQPTPDQFFQTVSEVIQPEGAASASTSSPSVPAGISPAGAAVPSTTTVTSAQASPQGPLDPTTLAVAGVRLGMTPDETVEALKNFDAFPVIQKRYIYSADDVASMTSVSRFGYGGIGVSADCPGYASRPNRLLVAIIAARAYRISAYRMVNGKKTGVKLNGACDWTGAFDSTSDQDPLEVAVFFSASPGKERVIAVSLTGSFDNKPLVKTVVDHALQRYSSEVTSRKDDGGNGGSVGLSWRFDGRNRLMSEANAMRTGLNETRFGGGFASLPGTIYATNGIGLDFGVSANSANKQLADSYWVRLYRESDLAQFTPQAKAFFRAFAIQQKQQEVDKAKQAGDPTKF